MKAFYGKGTYKRGDFPELKAKNLFAEKTPVEEDGVSLISRRGLDAHTDGLGSSAVVGGIRKDGSFGGDTFTVLANNTVLRAGTSIGTIDGSGPLSIDASDNEVCMTRGTREWSYNGTNLAAVAFPDGAAVQALAFDSGLWISLRAGTQKYYYSGVLDARTVDALSFASAESSPDPLRDVKVLNGTLHLFGSETIEPHVKTGNADAPYQRIEQRIFSKGITATGCVQEIDNTLAFTSSDGMAYRLADVPERISEHGMEERIDQCRKAGGTVSSFVYTDQGHSFYALRLTAGAGAGTFQIDFATSEWSELSSYGRDNWRGQCSIRLEDRYIFGDDSTGRLLEFGEGYSDITDPLERLFTFGVPLTGGTLTADNIILRANPGRTGLLTGQGTNPVAELRTSRNYGATFTDRREASLGPQGAYETDTIWRRCGTFARPGLYGEIRVTDPISLRVSGVYINEAGGGRSR